MTALAFYKVNTVPGSWQPDALYFVVNGGYSETYLTSHTGVPKAVGNSAMINALVTAAMGTYSLLRHVATIAARNSDKASTTGNTMYLVTDATGDSSVASGAALYFYDKTADTFTKVAEYESMDVVLQWANIQGGPSSTPAAIDDAVGKRHAHTNKAVLDKLGEDGGGSVTYNGAAIGGGASWGSTDW